jgi:hypothetical protein
LDEEDGIYRQKRAGQVEVLKVNLRLGPYSIQEMTTQ